MSENFEKLNDKELHQKFCSYGASAKEWMRKCELLLLEIDRRKIWKKRGFENVFVYAAALAGMSRYRVEQALRAARKVEQFPELQPVFEVHGVGAVRPILGVVDSTSAAFWARKAGEMSVHALEAYVRTAKEQRLIELTQGILLIDWCRRIGRRGYNGHHLIVYEKSCDKMVTPEVFSDIFSAL